MRRLTSILALLALSALFSAAPALADEFGFKNFDLSFQNEDGSPARQAGSHPFAIVTTVDFNTTVDPQNGVVPIDAVKDIRVELPPGQVGSLTAVPTCPSALFLADATHDTVGLGDPECPPGSQVGVIEYSIGGKGFALQAPVYNVEPPPGVPAKLGFGALGGVPVTIDLSLNPDPPYNVIATPTNVSQALAIFGTKLTVWGNPADPVHDSERGPCLGNKAKTICPANVATLPFVTLPTACLGPLPTVYSAVSWQNPGVEVGGVQLTHDDAEPPNPIGMSGCGDLPFSVAVAARATSTMASSPSGLDFSLDVDDPGLTSPTGRAQSAIRRAVVTLPEGFTANPSLAAGLAGCSEVELARETASSPPGAGCPEAAKIGTVEVQTPLVDESLQGSLFVAEPFENPFGSLVALYMVIKNPNLGIVIRQPLKVEPDPITGQVRTVADELPQLPFSHFTLHLREGARSPLATPAGCGTYTASSVLTPWSGGPPVSSSPTFEIKVGSAGGACPSGAPPFSPGLVAGTLSNSAGTYAPFNLRLSRSDSEGEFRSFSLKMPPGVLAKLAGVSFCPEASIAAARARTGPHGGLEELEQPSCPAASQIGSTLVGAGVGPELAYAPGKVYLAGPFNGRPLSIVAITAAKVGPFDLGTVVLREAIKIDPETAEATIEPAASDPIPRIIAGLAVHARDIRVYVDRPDFVLNPTSCKRTATASTVFGSGIFPAAGDVSATPSTPFQAADCASLKFAPRLSLSLEGGTKRAQVPKFKAVLRPRKGDANIGFAQVTLPHSVFLEQNHIGTVCTRVQFAAGAGNGSQCPKGSVYGRAKAISPLLDEPVTGPVILRSSNHPLPDLVAALHSSKLDFNLVGQIDSVGNGRIRNTFRGTPDAPVTKFVLEMQGGKKGILVNSTDLCRHANRALVRFEGQNGRLFTSKPVLKPDC